jgi:hypothetical protein
MNPITKLHLRSAVYCALLIGLNWFRSVDYSRPFGVTSESFAPIGLALLLSAAVALYLAYRCVRAALSRLERGKKVREGRWIESWSVMVYALPLLWHRTSSSSWTESDGSLATATGGFGHALSGWVFLLAILGLLLFQILARLADDDEEPSQCITDNSGAPPGRA